MPESASAPRIFKMSTRLYGIIFLLMILVLVNASLVVSNNSHILLSDPHTFHILKITGIGLALVLLPLAWSYPQRRIKNIDKTLDLPQKMMGYHKALRVRFFLAAAASIGVSILFLMIGDTDLMLVLAIILLFFIISRPTPFKAAADLDLSDEEKNQLITKQ